MRLRAPFILVALFVLSLTHAAHAQQMDSSAAARVGALLGVLADDTMEGRGTASRGGAAAARFIAAELERAGLRPAGAGR